MSLILQVPRVHSSSRVAAPSTAVMGTQTIQEASCPGGARGALGDSGLKSDNSDVVISAESRGPWPKGGGGEAGSAG